MSDFAEYAGFLVNYMFGRKHVPKCVSKVLEKLEKKKNKLISLRTAVEQTLSTINRDTDEVSDNVRDWLKVTDELLKKMENLRTQRKVPSWSEFKKLQKRIKAHNMKCYIKREDFIRFKSREKASDELLKALQDHNCYKIGLFGRQGSGKTCLVKAMANKVNKYFYKVLFVTVTHNPNIETIQNEIADSLNLNNYNNYNEDWKAYIISSRIRYSDRPILVIFDDVREKIDLQRIGIPCDSNRCKVVLTTRCQEECDFIDCQKEIQLDPLSIWEACTLFEKHSGIHGEKNSTSPELLNIAREIVSQCDGLPGKIIKGYTHKPRQNYEYKLIRQIVEMVNDKCLYMD
ncbi:hypothetical protein P8452_44765 [Trifolium repens]|nr:hypothetical protein P8452_44765 [Trifolium repens]